MWILGQPPQLKLPVDPALLIPAHFPYQQLLARPDTTSWYDSVEDQVVKPRVVHILFTSVGIAHYHQLLKLVYIALGVDDLV